MSDFALIPQQASTVASRVDLLFIGLLLFSIVSATIVVAFVLYFAIRYRRGSSASRAGKSEGSWKMEVTWIVIPVFLAIGVFLAGAVVYLDISKPPKDALNIYVVGKQWMWKIQHPQGQREINELHVPIGRPIKLLITSQDVIHSFFVPAFRIKMDAVPGRYTTAWFEAKEPGVYHLFCAEYCGTEHSRMIGKVIAMTPADYERWLQGESSSIASGGTMIERGEALFQSLGCYSCHGGTAIAQGPDLKGVFGSEVKLADGSVVTVDTEYVRESVLRPNEKIVAGYAPIMPSYENLVSEEDILQLAAYIESLATSTDEAATGGQ